MHPEGHLRAAPPRSPDSMSDLTGSLRPRPWRRHNTPQRGASKAPAQVKTHGLLSAERVLVYQRQKGHLSLALLQVLSNT